MELSERCAGECPSMDFPPFCGRVEKRVECKRRSEEYASVTEVYPRVQNGFRSVVEAAGALVRWRRLAAEVVGRIRGGRELGVCGVREAKRVGGRESQAAV